MGHHMEFNEKLQELRNKKGLTQQELAEKLYVSRTAISKWESGRGYPSIESLRCIAKFFSVKVDELISPDEALDIAERDTENKRSHFRDLVYGLLDLCVSLFLFLPFFATRKEGAVQVASFISANEIRPYLKAVFLAVVILITVFGILTLALQNVRIKAWVKSKTIISFVLGVLLVSLFIICTQPYAAIYALVLLLIKTLIVIKWH